jgi:hypothetical protein
MTTSIAGGVQKPVANAQKNAARWVKPQARVNNLLALDVSFLTTRERCGMPFSGGHAKNQRKTKLEECGSNGTKARKAS